MIYMAFSLYWPPTSSDHMWLLFCWTRNAL